MVLHYSPIEATVEGEPLGRYGVTAVVHGHAHKGSPEGRTSTNIPVYNVALPLMRKMTPDTPFRILEI